MFTKNKNKAVYQKYISPKELGARFGKSAEWARSLVTKKRIKATKEFGSIMIPITEVGRILSCARKGKA
jgi:hypothetical protein